MCKEHRISNVFISYFQQFTFYLYIKEFLNSLWISIIFWWLLGNLSKALNVFSLFGILLSFTKSISWVCSLALESWKITMEMLLYVRKFKKETLENCSKRLLYMELSVRYYSQWIQFSFEKAEKKIPYGIVVVGKILWIFFPTSLFSQMQKRQHTKNIPETQSSWGIENTKISIEL